MGSRASPKVWRRKTLFSLPGIEPQLLGGPFRSLVTVLTELSCLFCLFFIVDLGTVFVLGRWTNPGTDGGNRNLAMISVLVRRILYYPLPDIYQLRPEC
jgi:hypothetical protein